MSQLTGNSSKLWSGSTFISSIIHSSLFIFH